MLCPNCKQEITHVLRFLVMDVGDPCPIDSDGNVDLVTEVPGVDSVEEEHDGGDCGVWYECPKCRIRIETPDGNDKWDADGVSGDVTNWLEENDDDEEEVD